MLSIRVWPMFELDNILTRSIEREVNKKNFQSKEK
jgi:hypothetical protein